MEENCWEIPLEKPQLRPKKAFGKGGKFVKQRHGELYFMAVNERNEYFLPAENVTFSKRGGSSKNVGFSPGVVYSLDKKYMWNWVDEYMVGDSLKLLQSEIGLSCVEVLRNRLGTSACVRNRIRHLATKAYHFVDKNGEVVHKFAKHFAAQQNTLVLPPKPKRKRKNNRRLQHIETTEGGTVENSVHIRCIVDREHPSRSLLETRCCDFHDRADAGEKQSKAKRKRIGAKKSAALEFLSYSKVQYSKSVSRESEEVDDEVRPISPSNVSLADFVAVPQGCRRKKRSKQESGNFQPNYKGNLVYISSPSENSETVESSTVGNSVEISRQISVHFPFDNYIALEVLSSEIECENLKKEFGDAYYECSTSPRRFVVDLTGTVKRVMTVSHGIGVDTKDVEVLAVVENVPNFSFLCKSAAWGEEMTTTVNIWLNGVFTKAAEGSIILPKIKNLKKQPTLTDYFEKIALNIGTFPLTFFGDFESEVDQDYGSRKNSLNFDCLPAKMLPREAISLSGREVGRVLLSDGNFSNKLQRHVSALEESDGDFFTKLLGVEKLNFCEICSDQLASSGGWQLASCGHWFCNSCWTGHCVQQLQFGLAPISCPAYIIKSSRNCAASKVRKTFWRNWQENSCDLSLDYDTLTSVLPLVFCRRYASLLSEKYLLNSRHMWMWCPRETCRSLLKIGRITAGFQKYVTKLFSELQAARELCVPESHFPEAHSSRTGWIFQSFCPGTSITQCNSCNKVWCSDCAAPNHWPLSCDEFSLYWKRLKDFGDDQSIPGAAEKHFASVKRCPTCQNPLEKVFGCNHVMCRCGAEFCYSCLSIWNSGKHYECKLEAKAGLENKNVQSILMRDVKKGLDGSMSRRYYNLCVEHRAKAIRAGDLFKYADDDESTALRLYARAHQCLEMCYAFVYFSLKSCKIQGNHERKNLLLGVKWTAERLAYAVAKVENVAFSVRNTSNSRLKKQSHGERVEHVKRLTNTVVKMMTALKMSESTYCT